MPIYDFSCPHCGHKFSKLIRYATSYGHIIACPNCSKDATRVPEVYNHTWDTRWSEFFDEKYAPLNPTAEDRNIY